MRFPEVWGRQLRQGGLACLLCRCAALSLSLSLSPSLSMEGISQIPAQRMPFSPLCHHRSSYCHLTVLHWLVCLLTVGGFPPLDRKLQGAQDSV